MADPMTVTVLPARSGRWERAVSRVSGERLPMQLASAATLRRLLDPWTCPEGELELLAWAWSVDIWKSWWPVSRKRQIIAESPLFHERKTTVSGIRMALGYEDADLTIAHLPRHGIFCDREMSAAAQASWEANLPEIRIHDPAPAVLARRPQGFAGVNLFARGDARLARRAVLTDGDTETRLRIIPLDRAETPNAGDGERIVFPIGRWTGSICGHTGNRAAFPREIPARVLAIRLGSPGDRYVRPAATPGDRRALVSVRRRRLLTDPTQVFTPAGRGGRRVAAPRSVTRGYLAIRYSDRPGRVTALAPLNVVGRSRVMRPAYTAAYVVDWSQRRPRTHLPRGRRVADDSAAKAVELMTAIQTASAARDRASISFSATRRLTYADVVAISTGTRFGDRKERI